MAARLIVLAIATGNQALSGLSAAVDDVALSGDGMRVLCVGQTNRIQNGVWQVHSGAWTRPSDYAAASNQAGTVVTASSGTRYTGTSWLCAVMPAIVETNATAWACSPSWAPAPSGSTSTFLRGDGTWAEPVAAAGAPPVDSVHISFVSTNPATYWPGTTWAAVGAGRVLVGFASGDPDFGTAGATPGAKTVTLDASMIPSHTHVQNSHTHTQDSHNHTQNAHSHGLAEGTTDGSGTFMDRSNAAAATTATTDAATATNNATAATNQAAIAVNQSTGGGLAHNNIQPSLVVYFFRRTA